jgi:CRP-like cAMP-binding protein
MLVEMLEQKHVFEFLTPRQINALSEASEVMKLKTGQAVYEKGEKADYFYVVLTGEVELRLPGKGSASILIDSVAKGAMFGSCLFFSLSSYFCIAQCAKESELLRIHTAALKKILDDDPRMGYAVQSRISQIYFSRYMETMKKLQAVVLEMPTESWS